MGLLMTKGALTAGNQTASLSCPSFSFPLVVIVVMTWHYTHIGLCSSLGDTLMQL